MARVNFKKFPLFMDIAHKQLLVRDVKDEMCGLIYAHGVGIAYRDLARKIYNAEDEVVLDEEESKLLLEFARSMFTPNMIDSLEQVLATQ